MTNQITLFRKILGALAIANFFSTSAPAREEDGSGGWTGGGGDLRPLHIKQAQAQVPGQLLKLYDKLYQIKDPSETQKKALEFIKTHRDALSEEVRSSTITWIEGAHPETSKCAYTQKGKSRSPIILSFLNCIGILNADDAGKLLIHESVHHLDANASEDFADAVAETFYLIWSKLLTNSIPLCEDSGQAVASSETNTIRRKLTWAEAENFKQEGYRIDWYMKERHIIGDWIHDDGSPNPIEMSYTYDESMLEKLPGVGHCAYLGGLFKFKKRDRAFEYPYALIQFNGSPMIVYFKPRNGDPYGNGESNYVTLVKNDVNTYGERDDQLHLAGDFPDSGTTAFTRKGAQGLPPVSSYFVTISGHFNQTGATPAQEISCSPLNSAVGRFTSITRDGLFYLNLLELGQERTLKCKITSLPGTGVPLTILLKNGRVVDQFQLFAGHTFFGEIYWTLSSSGTPIAQIKEENILGAGLK